MGYQHDYESAADDLLMYEDRVAEAAAKMKAAESHRDKAAADLRELLKAHNLKSVTVAGKRITFRTEKRWRGPVELMRQHCIKGGQEELLTVKEREYTAWVNALDQAGCPIPPEVKNINLVSHSITKV